MSKPLFSCVVPVKGSRLYFDEAIASLKGQGLGDELEIIVQDGDAEPDSGQSDALNKGFAKAKGEWLFWLNADDVLLSGALKKVLDRINRIDKIKWLAGDTVYIDEAGKVRDVRCDAKWRSWFGKKLSVWTGGPSAFFRRELWEKRGGFDAEFKYAMDIDLWTRWAKAGEKFVGLGDYVWGFRVHGGSKTGSGYNVAAQAKELKVVRERYGIGNEWLWRNLTRAASVLDGTWFKRKRDSRSIQGKRVHKWSLNGWRESKVKIVEE